jgi:hypothetical protein
MAQKAGAFVTLQFESKELAAPVTVGNNGRLIAMWRIMAASFDWRSTCALFQSTHGSEKTFEWPRIFGHNPVPLFKVIIIIMYNHHQKEREIHPRSRPFWGRPRHKRTFVQRRSMTLCFSLSAVSHGELVISGPQRANVSF